MALSRSSRSQAMLWIIAVTLDLEDSSSAGIEHNCCTARWPSFSQSVWFLGGTAVKLRTPKPQTLRPRRSKLQQDQR
eukprot:3586359-Amphidinium_carterae.1